MSAGRWGYAWRWGRRPKSSPNDPAVPRWWALTCGRCDWRGDFVDRYQGPAAASKRATAAFDYHYDQHRE